VPGSHVHVGPPRDRAQHRMAVGDHGPDADPDLEQGDVGNSTSGTWAPRSR
jgi:hypothetical protein